MPKLTRFEDLTCWQQARKIVNVFAVPPCFIQIIVLKCNTGAHK